MLAANMPVKKLHPASVERVRANYQSRAAMLIEPMLTEDEAAVMKRGRNASCGSGSIPKSSDPAEYHRATSLETLFGYLQLLGRELLVALHQIERFHARATDEVLAVVEQVVAALFRVLVSAHPAHERGVSALLRVQGEVPSAEGLVARSALQRTGLAAFGTWSRSHWSGNCRGGRFA